MIKASVRMISLAFWPWRHTAFIVLMILLLYFGDGNHVLPAAAQQAAAPPTAAEPPLYNQAIGGVASSIPSTILFNQTKTMSCDSKVKPGFFTTIFLYNAPFTFGCLNNDPSYYISVALSSINFPITPIWLANRYYPVKDNAFLSLTPQGSLLLQDSNGTHVWSSRPSSSTPAGLRLTAQGNLILFDHKDASLWESFSEPVDVLVPGQTLNPGSALVAGFSSQAKQMGNFVAEMKPGGLVLYENSSSQPLPYYALRYPFNSTDMNGVLQSPCNHTQLQLTSDSLTQVQSFYTPSCEQAGPHAITFGSPIVFVRLERNGVVKAYYPDHNPTYDLFQNSSRGPCGIPNVCGFYGICENSSQCACPPGNDSTGQYFTNSSDEYVPLSSASCIPKVAPLTCRDGSRAASDHHFLDLKQVDYFANDFIKATLSTENFDLCKAACAGNCSCLVAFYRNTSKECFLHENVLSMIRVETPTYLAAIKLQKQSSSKGVSEMRLIVGISVAVLVSILLFGVWYCHHRRKRSAHRPLSKDEDDLFSSLPGQAKRFRFKELQAATSDFSERLGVGGFGSVYKGVFGDGTVVAVKQLENMTRFTQGMKEFRNEVMALSNINHQNLVHLRGFCADGGHRLLVYEYVPNGSLDAWLFQKGADRPGPPLDWKTRLTIAVHTARGLVFLHEQCRNRIVHLDIKPQNILLDEQFLPKLSDFGLSRLINEDNDSAVSRMRGTPGYMAPECLILSDASEKSDVYSFGMVLLEIVSGRKNVDLSRLVVHGDGDGWYFPAMAARKCREGNITDIIDKSLGQLGSEDVAEATRVIKIAFWCIQDDPSLRPTMGNALLMLEGYSEVSEPPLSYQFGMRFHLSNSFTSGTPQHISSSEKHAENGDHQSKKESEAEMKDQQNQEGEGESKGILSRRTSPLSSHQASPRSSSVLSSSLHTSIPSSDVQQASPPRLSPAPNISSPHSSPLKSYESSPRHSSPTSSPRRTSPLPSSPLSHNSASPFQDMPAHARSPSSTLSAYRSPVASPRNV